MTTLKLFLSKSYYLIPIALFQLFSACSTPTELKIVHGDLVFSMNTKMQTQLSSNKEGALPITGNFQSSEFLVLRNSAADLFDIQSLSENDLTDGILGKEYEIRGV